MVGAREHYLAGTSLHLRKRIATGVTHHPPRVANITIFGVPGWAQSIENGPIHGKHSTLAGTQVCKCVVGQGRGEIRTFVSGELAGWIEKMHTWQRAVKQEIALTQLC